MKDIKKWFKLRFPSDYKWREEQDAWGGYYAEWVHRFSMGRPELYMDKESLELYTHLEEY